MRFIEDGEASGSRIDWDSKLWMKKYEMVLATNENLSGLVDECIESGKYGLDLETTGLDARVFPSTSEEGVSYQTKDVIVGVCISPAGVKKGAYIPLRHRNGVENNVSYSVFLENFRRLIESKSIPVFHNGKFDQEFLEFPGHEPLGNYDDQKTWEDTILLAYLRNPKQKTLGLKRLSKEELGKEMIELSELFPVGTKQLDFSSLDPASEGVVEYACSDAICTIELENKIRNQALNLKGKSESKKPHTQDVIYAIEKICIPATRWMERNRLHIDLKKVGELIQLGQQECVRSLDRMYKEASEALGRDITPLYHYILTQKIQERNPLLEASDDPEAKLKGMLEESRSEADRIIRLSKKKDRMVRARIRADEKLAKMLERESPGAKGGIELLVEYDIMSGQKLGVLLHDLGLPNLKRTDSGQISTDKNTLEKYLEDIKLKAKFPFLGLVKWFRENQNALGKLEALYEDTNKEDNSLWVKFKNTGTDTGRFASPGDKKHKSSGGTRFNLQSMPAIYATGRPPALLRLRECICARPGYFMAAVDFSGVELRIVSNLSGEPKWIDAFFSCSDCGEKFNRGDGTQTPKAPPKYCPVCGSDKIGDIHTMTALAIYGEKAQEKDNWKELRGNGKSTNFALCYGGSGKAVVRSTGCSENEGYRIKKQFDATYKVLKGWWDRTRKEARKNKYVRTDFGRQYPTPEINDEDHFWRAKAERNAINAPIQGSSADITKLAMARIYDTCKKRGWLDKVLMVATMHDELVFEIEKSIIEEALEMIADTMARNNIILKRKWAVPLTVDVEIGENWTVPWDLYKIQHKVSLRKQLETPGLSEGEIKGILRKLLQIIPSDKLREKGLESIEWPEPLKPYFKGAESVRTEESIDALNRAYTILFNEDYIPSGTTQKPEGGKITENSEEEIFDLSEIEDEKEEVEVKAGVGLPEGFVFHLPEILSIDFALKLSEALCKGLSENGCRFRILTSTGQDVTPEGVGLINPDIFMKEIKS